VERKETELKILSTCFREQYSKFDFLFDTLKWNIKIDFEKPAMGEGERKANGSERQI
jgi:hypothetical protein